MMPRCEMLRPIFKPCSEVVISNTGLLIAVLVLGFGSPSAFAESGEPLSANNITLSDTCPAGFHLGEANGCRLVSMYKDYASLQNMGLGGLRTGLPEVRDGFSPQQIDLGRYLFFDPLLSVDQSLSCASCHHPDKGFSDGLPRSVGMAGVELDRAAPSLWNVAFLNRFFWDGRASSLEQQIEGPLYAEHEMGNSRAKLLSSLNAVPEYKKLFKQAFPDASSGIITLDQIYRSLAAFEASLISLNSRYDLYANGFHDVLSEKEIEGMNVFRSFVARCAECHTPPLFTNQQIAVLGTPEPEGRPLDIGAEGASGDPTQRAGFKVPSLRNIALSAPYMHSGRFDTLRDASEFYTLGRGHAVPEGENLKIHWHIWEPQLADHELDSIVEFLHTLTDESYKPQTPKVLPSGLPLVHEDGHSQMADKGVNH